MDKILIPPEEPVEAGAGSKSQGRSSHIPALDGLRGVAVLLVLFFHLNTFSFEGRGPAVHLVGVVAQNGWMGVEVFFALSGFLITNILLSTVDDSRYFRNFYVRRTLRIFPLYYGVIVLLAACSIPLHIKWNGSFFYFFFYLQNYLSTERLWLQSSIGTIRLSHLWSLAVEEQFYFLWPFLVWVFKGRRSFFAVPLALIVLEPTARWIAYKYDVPYFTLYTWTPFRLDSLAWGALAALLLREGNLRLTETVRWLSMAVGTCLLVLILVGRLIGTDAIAAVGMLTCGILLSITQSGTLLERFYRLSVLRWFGRYSYGIYVYHYIFVSIYGYPRWYLDRVTGLRPLGALAALVSGLLFSSGLAWISYHVYERQFLKLKDVLGRYGKVRVGQSSFR